MKKIKTSQEKRIEEAMKRLQEMQKTIAPFSNPREVVEISTMGRWRIPSISSYFIDKNRDTC